MKHAQEKGLTSQAKRARLAQPPLNAHVFPSELTASQIHAVDAPSASASKQYLDEYAARLLRRRPHLLGYPVNEHTHLKEFYEWYLESGLYKASINNVGDPFLPAEYDLHTHPFEREVIHFFAPLYGFEPGQYWGFVTASGTDGNQHGMYFGARYLLSMISDLEKQQQLQKELSSPDDSGATQDNSGASVQRRPIAYVSTEAHYSIKKLADVDNIELRLIAADVGGRMDIEEFERQLDPMRPALIVVAMGTTFKGAIDDQEAIDAVIKRKKPVAVYRHLDAALFGGYLPFTEFSHLVDRRKVEFDSIAVSGHKFFGFDEPCGLFLCTQKVRQHLNPFRVEYLSEAIPTITCSRGGLAPLKFWWKISHRGALVMKAEAETMLANARHLQDRLTAVLGADKVWRNPHSNTVYFARPAGAIMTEYDLAPEVDYRLVPDGLLAHTIVMQHVTIEAIDSFVAAVAASCAVQLPPAVGLQVQQME
eukprot:m.70224 g.70224  ORF g.70224 m.70224 type:complete len:479 (+) comp7581_c0_seq1:189-1625(+)